MTIVTNHVVAMEDIEDSGRITDKVVLSNVVKLQLPSLMRIHPVVNISQII